MAAKTTCTEFGTASISWNFVLEVVRQHFLIDMSVPSQILMSDKDKMLTWSGICVTT